MATGAWSATAWLCAVVANSGMVQRDVAAQPYDFDPYGLLQDDAQRAKRDDIQPYDPAVLQALQDSGRFG